MGNLIEFPVRFPKTGDKKESRSQDGQNPLNKGETAQLLFFTGIRYERMADNVEVKTKKAEIR